VEQQCQVAEVSRASFYRYLQQTTPEQADLLLRARLQELAVAHHRLRGYRMLTALLRREGQLVNHKRVLRLMREDNLLSLRRKKYVFTTDSAHTFLPEPGAVCEVDDGEPTVGGRHYLHSPAQ
jgi:transposase InsO family protein